MDTLVCQIEGHNNDKIVAICMDKQCKSKQRICCLQCLIAHSTHQKKTIQVDRMSAFIQQENQKQNISPESFNNGKKQIIEGFENLLTLMNDFQKILNERMTAFKTIIMNKIETLKQKNLQKYLRKNFGNQKGFEYWNKLLEGILEYVEVDNCIINTTAQKEAQLNETDMEHINIIKQSEKSLQAIINQITKAKNIPKLSFSVNRKNANIAIIDECTIKSIDSTLKFQMAFANEGFDPNKQSYSFAFNIQKIGCVGWIAVGVGNDVGYNMLNYQFNKHKNLGHGQYLNSYITQTYHHSDSQINSKQYGLHYKDKDIIQIRYDHTTKVLEFRKQSEKDIIVRMLITDMTKILYPCVVFYINGGKIQLTTY